MSEVLYDFEASRDVLAAILERAKAEGIECSDPAPSGDGGRALHSPLSGAEIKDALEIAILVFKTGTAASAFLVSVHELLSVFGVKGLVRVTDRQTKKPLLIDSQNPTPDLLPDK
jgi:hypothetical protein